MKLKTIKTALASVKDMLPRPVITGNYTENRLYVSMRGFSPIEIDIQDSLKLENHSPTGFSWGYSGSGPAQTALGILLLFCTKDDALRLYQKFKSDIISGLPKSDFELSVSRVESWLHLNS